MTDVAVLGCGPAGLLAAHAAVTLGHRVTIYSQERKPSAIGGAQFLHIPIPGLTRPEPDGFLTFRQMGNERGYARKVYGDPFAPTSWGAYPPGVYGVWNMQQAYDNLWERYHDLIVEKVVTWHSIKENLGGHDTIFSCIPAPVICPHRDELESPDCKFTSQPVWISPGGCLAEMTVVYSGNPDDAWYRTCNIFGHGFSEYPTEREDARRIVKPLHTNCPGPEGVVRLGRYGQWKKGVLIHDAYIGASNALHRMQ